jgi:hypothetical protein
MVRVNIDAADNRYENFIRILRARVISLRAAAAKPRTQFPKLRRLFPISSHGIDPVLFAEEAMKLRNFAAVAELLAVVNCAGFQRILDKFDRRSGARPFAPRVLAGLASRGFARDASSPPGQGRLAALRNELTRTFGLPAESARARVPNGRIPAGGGGGGGGFSGSGRCGADVGGAGAGEGPRPAACLSSGRGPHRRPAWALPPAITR